MLEMMFLKEKFLFSTTAADAPELARKYGFGVELADFCTASNMDEPDFSRFGPEALKKLEGIGLKVFHAPFNELYPAAIEPLVVDIAYRRLVQAAKLASSMGISFMVVHGGYVPLVYFKEWHHERSVIFWQKLSGMLPDGFRIAIENVMEDDPDMIPAIVREVNDPRVGICIDIGHANASSKIPAERWIEAAAPFLTHLHIHNNYGDWDTHNCPGDGSMDAESLMRLAHRLAPDATMTLEVTDAAEAYRWLREKSLV